MVQIQDNSPHDSLSTEAIQRAPRPLESVDNIKGRDSFPLSVFCVSDRITNDLGEVLEKDTMQRINFSHSQGRF